MTRPTYISGGRQRRFGTASSDARAARLADQLPLEELEEMAVITKDAARRAELEAAVRIGRIARGGTYDSGGAVRMDADDAPASGGRVVLDSSLRARLTESIPAWDASEAIAPEPSRAPRRWRLAMWRR